MTADDIAVFYIARGGEGGLESAQRFLDSYKARRSGQAHSLKVITKGWASKSEQAQVHSMFAATDCEMLPLPDDGFDLGAYFRSAMQTSARWITCVNTHSEILADDWLKRLFDGVRAPGVGAAGATGSWESHFTDQSRFPRPKNAGGKIKRFATLSWYRYYFPKFPNAHLRTNAFMMRRSDLVAFAAKTRLPLSKERAFVIESGRSGLTTFLQKADLQVVVCGADGNTFLIDQWPASRTLFSGNQENLLVGDRLTRRYQQADRKQRLGFQVAAWGTRATFLSGEPGAA